MTRILIEPDANYLRVSLESDELGAWTPLDGYWHPFGSNITPRMVQLGTLPSRLHDGETFLPTRFLRVIRGLWAS